MLIGADVVFALLALGGNLPVGVIVEGIGIDARFEQDGLAVVAPFRVRGAGGQIGEPAGLATRNQIENVDLFDLVSFPFGGEGDTVAVLRPGGSALGRLGVGQAARRYSALMRRASSSWSSRMTEQASPRISSRLLQCASRS